MTTRGNPEPYSFQAQPKRDGVGLTKPVTGEKIKLKTLRYANTQSQIDYIQMGFSYGYQISEKEHE